MRLTFAMFISGEAHWLGIQIQGEEEQARVMLLGVPYALKAADAETLGGKPPSAFVLAEAPSDRSTKGATEVGMSILGPQMHQPPTTALALAGTGDTNFVAKFIDPATLGDSAIYESGGYVGIGTSTPAATLDVLGNVKALGLDLPATGTATGAQGFNSNPLDLVASTFDSRSAAVEQRFRWLVEPVGNNTANPSGRLSLQFASGGGSPTGTGLWIDSDGTFNFNSAQTFPGTAVLADPNTFTAPNVMRGASPSSVPLTVAGAAGQTVSLLEVKNSAGQALFRVLPNGILEGGTPGGSLTIRPSPDSNGNLVLSPAKATNSVFAMPAVGNQSASLLVARAGAGQTGPLIEAQQYSTAAPLFSVATSAATTIRNFADQTLALRFSPGQTTPQHTELQVFDRALLQDKLLYTLRFTADGHADFLGGPTQMRRLRVRGDADMLTFGSAMDTNLYRSAPSTLKTDGALVIGVQAPPSPLSPGTPLYVVGNSPTSEVLAVDSLASQVADLQTWRVGGRLKASITAAGTAGLSGISFADSLGGGNGSIRETAGGALTIASGASSHGDQVFNAQSAGHHIYQYGGVARQFFDNTGLTFENSQTVRFKTREGAPGTVLQGRSGNSVALGSLGNGIRFMSAGLGSVLLATTETGVAPDSRGLKHRRVPTGSIAAKDSAAITLAWATPFADVNYTVNCSVVDPAATTSGLRIHHIQSVAQGWVTLLVANDDAAMGRAGTLHCTAIHD